MLAMDPRQGISARAGALLVASAFTVLAASALSCAAQTGGWKPSKNVEIIVGVSPGGGIDRTARAIQKIIQDMRLLDVTASVVNKPGGGSTIAQAYLNQHAGDAHYFEITATSLLTNHILGKSPHGYSDFTPIAMLYDEYIGFAVKSDSPIKSGKELLEVLKNNPDTLAIGIATSAGNTNHKWKNEIEKAGGVNHYMNSRDLRKYFEAQHAQFRAIPIDLGLAK